MAYKEVKAIKTMSGEVHVTLTNFAGHETQVIVLPETVMILEHNQRTHEVDIKTR